MIAKREKEDLDFNPKLFITYYNCRLRSCLGFRTEPQSVVGDDKSGDLSLAALYNFNTETLTAPAFQRESELDSQRVCNQRG